MQEVCRKARYHYWLRTGLCRAAQQSCENEHPPDGQRADGGDANGGVSGGGHLIVGSIKFVGGMRKDVLAKLAEKIAACGVDAVPAPKSG